MRKVAILMAVEQYSDKRISGVAYAQADAQELGAALQEHGFSPADQAILIDVAATKTSIESRVRKVLASLSKDDTLHFYFRRIQEIGLQANRDVPRLLRERNVGQRGHSWHIHRSN